MYPYGIVINNPQHLVPTTEDDMEQVDGNTNITQAVKHGLISREN